MIRKTALALVCAVALSACSMVPQASGGGDAAGASASAAAAAEKLRVVMIDPDRASLDALVADDLTYGHSGGKVDTKTSFMADLLNGNSDFVTITISDQTVKAVNGVVLVRHTLTGQTLDGGKPSNVNLKVLQVWQQQGGQWRLLARQAVRAA